MTKLVINEVVAKAVISCLAISGFYITERLIVKELSRRLMLVGSDSCCVERNDWKGEAGQGKATRAVWMCSGGDIIPTTLSSQSVRDYGRERIVCLVPYNKIFFVLENQAFSNFE